MLLDNRGYPDNEHVHNMFTRLLKIAGVPNPPDNTDASSGTPSQDAVTPISPPSLEETLKNRLFMLVRSAITRLAAHQMEKHYSGRFQFHQETWKEQKSQQRLLNHFCLCPVDDRTRNLVDTIFQGLSPEQAIKLCFEPNALTLLLELCPNTYTFWQQVKRVMEHTLELAPLPLPVTAMELCHRLLIDYCPFGSSSPYSKEKMSRLKAEIHRQSGHFCPAHLPAPLACDYLQQGLILQDISRREQVGTARLVVNPLWEEYMKNLCDSVSEKSEGGRG